MQQTPNGRSKIRIVSITRTVEFMSGMAPTHDLQLKWKRGPQPLDVNSARLRQRTRGIDQSLRALTPLGAPIAEFVSGVNRVYGHWHRHDSTL